MTGAGDFETLCKSVAQQFLRTAVLIDDQIVTPSDVNVAIPGEQLVAPHFMEEAESAPAPQAALDDEKDGQEGAAQAIEPAPVVAAEEATVRLKPLADAFLDQKIICAVLNPVAKDAYNRIVERAVNAASFADIVIIDWYLRPGDAELTLESLTSLLSADAQLNGRKRLIIVYTSAVPLEDRHAELRDRIRAKGLACEEIEADYPALRSGASRILFVEKDSGKHGVPVEKLPEIALTQFVKEAQGLMPIFALGAIARIRDATHHMLTVFKPELDAALVGHRMVLIEPRDARDFVLEVLLLQLKGVLSADDTLGSVIDTAAVGAWFNHRFPPAMDAPLAAIGVNRDKFRNAVEEANPKETHGKTAVKNFHQALFLPDGGNRAETEVLRAGELARLSTHVREAEGATPLPTGWLPHLTLGSVLRMEVTDAPDVFLLCTQPLCDTLRLGKPAFFSFVTLVEGAADANDYSVVIRSDAKQTRLKASRKGIGRYFARFTPDEVQKKVIATSDGTKFTFTDDDAVKYRWIADIDRLKAQRAAEEMASALGRVGVDEFEWLRMGGQIAI